MISRFKHLQEKSVLKQTKNMTSDQYFRDAAREISTFEDIPSLEKWKSSTNAGVDSDRNATEGFDCNICLECVQEPVVTLCGHLYCWPCIYKWLHIQTISSKNMEQQKPQCPVCKSEVSQSSLVPLYGRNQVATPSGKNARQLGSSIPRRPPGRRPYNPAASVLQSTSETNQPRPFDSIQSSYTSTSGIFGEMIYARVFGNQLRNMYTYPNSYCLSGSSNPRIRRQLMEADESLSRICFFLFCCLVMCLLLF
ncbi:E3 ubiquitin-protein ligase RMA1H1 isoform X1 [Arachis duranensis]|uniref:E3 ubiquitin-protein ligase RMA n=2 Tax=Arachis duranensis TaxID=130453 RepID=A0A6P4CM82_ARADU|nr:E3 ubiquitin-protein ligase RMA1H1 isoform X1 [Arachis duranensis]